MLSEFLLYLVGILATVGGILLLERIVAGPHSTAGTGYARVDSAFDIDRLRRKQYRPRVPSVLRRGGRPALPLLQEVTRGRGNFGRPANSSSRSPASWGRLTAHLSCSTGTSGRSVIELAPAWAAYWSRCARVSHSRPSRCGHGAASTTFSTAIIGWQQPVPWVATTSALMSSKWLSCLATTLRR